MLASVLRAGTTLATVFIAWWLVVWLGNIPNYLLPSPDAVAAKLWFLITDVHLGRHLMATLIEIALGFVAGVVAGVLCGWLFVRKPLIDRLFSPVILLLQTAPKIALAPLLLLWLGLGLAPKVVLIAVVVFFPVLTGTMAGLSNIEPAYHELHRLLKLSPWVRFRRIELPFALPSIFAGIRIASTQAVTAAVVGELIGTNVGLGYLLSLGQENSDAGIVIATIIVLSTIGWLTYELCRTMEQRLVRE